jgi:hypothetical protein
MNTAIFELLPKVSADVGIVGKNRKNAQQGYSFRTIDDVVDACHGSFTKFSVTVIPEIVKVMREEKPTKSGGTMMFTLLEVKYSFYAPDGSSVSCLVLGEGADSGDKSANKAMSAAYKYAMGQVLSIPFNMDDSEKDSPELGTKRGATVIHMKQPMPTSVPQAEVPPKRPSEPKIEKKAAATPFAASEPPVSNGPVDGPSEPVVSGASIVTFKGKNYQTSGIEQKAFEEIAIWQGQSKENQKLWLEYAVGLGKKRLSELTKEEGLAFIMENILQSPDTPPAEPTIDDSWLTHNKAFWARLAEAGFTDAKEKEAIKRLVYVTQKVPSMKTLTKAHWEALEGLFDVYLKSDDDRAALRVTLNSLVV